MKWLYYPVILIECCLTSSEQYFTNIYDESQLEFGNFVITLIWQVMNKNWVGKIHIRIGRRTRETEDRIDRV